MTGSLILAILLLVATAGTPAGNMKEPAAAREHPAEASSATPAAPAAGTTAPAATAASGTVTLPEPGKQILFVDLDGDGRDDPVVVFGDGSGCRLARIARSGDSPRLDPLVLEGNPRLHAPAFGDADGDGTMDILSVADHSVVFRKGLGKGSFASPPLPLYGADGLLLPEEGCEAVSDYVRDLEDGPRPELVLPIAGGVRLVSLEGDSSSRIPAQDLLSQPSVQGAGEGLSLVSPLPVVVGSGKAQILVLGPVLEHSSPRLELSWWSRREDGTLDGHRSALSLPPGESAALVAPFDLEGDGRPEIAVLTVPNHLQNLLGEYDLRVFRASDRADSPVAPFFSGQTNINYWQYPSLVARPVAGGNDLLIAFYRGLVRDHLNVEVFRSDGSGSFEAKPRDIGLSTEGGEAHRGFLVWADVDGDGTADLLAASDAVRAYRGLPARDNPVADAADWVSSINPAPARTSISVDSTGAWTISFGAQGATVFRDLDGDGRAEAISIESPNVQGKVSGRMPDLPQVLAVQPFRPIPR